jgi:hypothetical protein
MRRRHGLLASYFLMCGHQVLWLNLPLRAQNGFAIALFYSTTGTAKRSSATGAGGAATSSP